MNINFKGDIELRFINDDLTYFVENERLKTKINIFKLIEELLGK